MKNLLIMGLALSFSAFAATNYVPNDGSAKPGNPGTGLGKAAPKTTGAGTDVNGPENLGAGSTNPSTAVSPSRTSDNSAAETLQTGTDTEVKESVNRANTSVNPVPEDTDDLTLKGKTQTGPYRTPGNNKPGTKQSQESTEEENLDYRAIPKVDHDDIDVSKNQ